MERPKTTQNMRIGIWASSVPVAVKSSAPDRLPSWKIHTMAPNVAVRLSTFSTSAFTGTRRLPVNRNSTTKVTSATIASATGSRLMSALLVSTN